MSDRLRLPESITACLFDLDGVLTRTAELHAAAWKQAFDELLRRRAAVVGATPVVFDLKGDYAAYVDGRPRAAGVRAFMASRGIVLAEGSAADPASADTVHGVGRRKTDLVGELLARCGVAAYPGSVRFLAAVQAAGLGVAVVTSSENATAVLRAAGLGDTFAVRVDGVVARRLGLAGKPAPDGFLEAARRLDALPAQAAVFEDALAGVAAGRGGGFGLVVGVNRSGQAAALHAHGADVVVDDLADLIGAR